MQGVLGTGMLHRLLIGSPGVLGTISTDVAILTEQGSLLWQGSWGDLWQGRWGDLWPAKLSVPADVGGTARLVGVTGRGERRVPGTERLRTEHALASPVDEETVGATGRGEQIISGTDRL